ncbi:MAG: N-acetyl-1-D-myo-inositol-2-amino-2-deoxy-alpha-D-glucopyranoside deacetylase [Pseudonocardia sp.]|nr:N-acetyl-1-D-myo-inositol-2-amino-2-deoxy-alpha-D-glucopyranoside deacetylase [Pseudonocardia sp.]
MTFPRTAGRRLLLVHAHPDDETLTTGGAIARYTAEPDTSVTVVTCTLGEEGEVIPPDLRELAPDRADQLGGYRVHELAGALAALGGPDHRYLGGAAYWRDSGMVLAGHGGVWAATPPELHPRAFAAPAAYDEQLARLLEILDEVRPQVVVSYAHDGGYGHPDHVRAHLLVTAAVEARRDVVARLFHAVVGRATLDKGLAGIVGLPGMPFVPPEDDELPGVADAEITTRLDVSAHREARIAAMRAHETQISVWESDSGPVALAMSNEVAQPFLDVEEYVLAYGAGPAPEDDLFAGLEP